MDREAETVPEGAASCAVSLDGGPLRPDGDEEALWREASGGTASFHGADGTRLKTLSFGPETGKTMAPPAAEVARVRKVRPDLKLVADVAPDNRTFLGKPRPDERAVDFFHACEDLGEVAEQAVAAGWYDRVTLRTDGGGDKVGDTPSPRQGDDENGDRGS